MLTDGLPERPRSPVPGQTFPAALHRGDRYGAVLFLRLWRNGQWDSDTAITRRTPEGWAEPWGCSGGPWVDPYSSSIRLDGQVEVFSTHMSEGVTASGDPAQFVAVEGMVAPAVASLLCATSTGSFTYSIDSAVRAFVIVVDGNESPSLVPLDRAGQPLGGDITH